MRMSCAPLARTRALGPHSHPWEWRMQSRTSECTVSGELSASLPESRAWAKQTRVPSRPLWLCHSHHPPYHHLPTISFPPNQQILMLSLVAHIPKLERFRDWHSPWARDMQTSRFSSWSSTSHQGKNPSSKARFVTNLERSKHTILTTITSHCDGQVLCQVLNIASKQCWPSCLPRGSEKLENLLLCK